jgi:uncharacterized protein
MKEKNGTISNNEKILKLRVRNTINVSNETILQLLENIEEYKELFSEFGHSTVRVEKQIYPNVDLNFGKYRRKIITAHQYVKIYLDNREIVISPL